MLGILSKGKAIDASQRRTLFESLMEQTQRQAYSLAYRLTGNPSEAEDLCQETYIRAYRFFHRYDESLPFANWLYRIMSNAHIDLMRRKGRLKTTRQGRFGRRDGRTPAERAANDDPRV